MITPQELGGAARKPVFRDFAVLVRANETGKIIKNYLCNHGIPAVVSKNQNFFNSSEISVVISFLKILVNPRQDIPLLAVMLSPIFDFTEDELALIRSADKQAALYEVIAASANEKCVRFILSFSDMNKICSLSAGITAERILTSDLRPGLYLGYQFADPEIISEIQERLCDSCELGISEVPVNSSFEDLFS